MPGLLEEQRTTTENDKTQQTGGAAAGANASAAGLPQGVVLGKDGKPCRTCSSSSAMMAMMRSSTSPNQPATTQASSPPTSQSIPDQAADCPPDVEELGRSSWTLLHALSATYPETPSPQHQTKTASFLHLFSQLYPCWVCADDFQAWLQDPANDPEKSGALKSQDGFGRWMCGAHNAVNVKLGKKEFDCNLWKERWKDGWKDGRCD